MESLRVEADTSNAKVEELTAKVKMLEQDNLSKEQEITSLTHRNQLLESEVEKLEEAVKTHKDLAAGGADHATQNETLQRRLQLLEDEAEEADKNLRETHEKYGFFVAPHVAHPRFRLTTSLLAHIYPPFSPFWFFLSLSFFFSPWKMLYRRRSKRLKTVPTKPADFYEPRLRQTDVKAGHYEHKVQALEKERDQWEEKYEEMNKKHKAVQKELEDFNAEMANI